MRYRRRKDPSARYYGTKETDDGIQLCPLCEKPVHMPDGITRGPDHALYHIDCILDEYWKLKGGRK